KRFYVYKSFLPSLLFHGHSARSTSRIYYIRILEYVTYQCLPDFRLFDITIRNSLISKL
ncbi:hypothetical protein BJV82DRAFT_585179, partial [Fennellomyces sp. T-0311]